jgi:RHS repeat-associated protein
MATYVYDALGNRQQADDWTSTGGVTTVTRLAYDGQNVYADMDGSNNLLMRRVYGDGTDQVIARESAGGTVAWYGTDRLGSVIGIVDATGTPIATFNYDGYGNQTVVSGGANGDRYGFTAREVDSVTGLQYNRARWYNPATGRWTAEDPAGFGAGDMNLYRYVGNNPTNGADPSGRKELPTIDYKVDGKVVGRLFITWEDTLGMQLEFLSEIPDRDHRSISKAAQALGGDHFNIYQIIVRTDRLAFSKNKPLTAPWIDPPPGGYSGIGKDGEHPLWKDGSPWGYSELRKPEDITLPTGGHVSDVTGPGTMVFKDNPHYAPKPTSSAGFMTWVVLVNKDGSLVRFLDGVEWTSTDTGGKTAISDVKPIPPMKPKTAVYQYYYTELAPLWPPPPPKVTPTFPNSTGKGTPDDLPKAPKTGPGNLPDSPASK